MKITARDMLLAQVEDSFVFLKHLIEEYPLLSKKKDEETIIFFKKEAEEIAEGDSEIYNSVYSTLLSYLEDSDFKKDLFYQAMVMLVYSFYERIIRSLADKANESTLIDAICKAKGITLSNEAIKAKEDINSNIRILRNQIVHNNFGTLKHNDDLKRMSKDWPEINCSDSISILGSDFILDSLKKEKLVLGMF
ncbi:MAG: hypothetical protein IKN83_12865 [Bacteroidaceae bacterium]|nr:hypothetical protein [Bacteroidaceae bacterium]